MKFREILDTINESILKIVSTKNVEKKDNLIINTTAGINVIITDYPLTKEQKKILLSIKSILSKEYSKGQEELSMDDLEKGLDDILSNEEIENELEELLKEEKKPKSKGRGRKKATAWINDLFNTEIEKDILKQWFDGDLLQIYVGSTSIKPQLLDRNQDNGVVFQRLTNKTGNLIAFEAYIKEDNSFVFTKITKNISAKDRTPTISVRTIPNKSAFDRALKKALTAYG